MYIKPGCLRFIFILPSPASLQFTGKRLTILSMGIMILLMAYPVHIMIISNTKRDSSKDNRGDFMIRCPVCNYLTIDDSFEVITDICPVCFWQYDWDDRNTLSHSPLLDL